MTEILTDYHASRARFRAALGEIQQRWPAAHLELYQVEAGEDLSIDRIEAPPVSEASRCILFTTGEHGIEGYLGAGLLDLFIQEYLPRLDPANTGLVLVHAINPWGMAHWERTNRENVDLNRNFLLDASELRQEHNPDYAQIEGFLNPARPLSRLSFWQMGLAVRMAWAARRIGAECFRRAALLGQYRFPHGLYYGGSQRQPEVAHLLALYRQALGTYRQVLLLDMHTGYGPRDEMALVNSGKETRRPEELAQSFDYPHVAATAGDFYEIRGDMIDAVYELRQAEYPDTRLYATSFEFGTFGNSSQDALRSIRAMILQNQARHYGARSEALRVQAAEEFRELFCPYRESWWVKAQEDARRALDGILRAEGFV